MKLPKIIFLTCAVSLPVAGPAQVLTADHVPAPVRQALQEKFPSVKSAEWKLKSDKNYEAEFTLKGTAIAAKFDSAGKWLETESAMSRSMLSKSVRESADRKFKGYKVIETQSVRRWNEEPLIFELHLENAREIIKAQFSAQGTILNQSAKPKPDKPAKQKN